MTRLSTREKYIVTAGSILAAVFLCLQFVILPLVDRQKEMARIVKIEQEAVAEIGALRQRYRSLTTGMDNEQDLMAARPHDFTLFSFLDFQAEKSGIKQNIDYMRPFSQDLGDGGYRLSKVRLKLKNLYLDDFINFLAGVETSGNGVHIISLSLSRTGEQANLLEAVMEAQTLMQKDDR
jgi:general secretion pathway protein M